MSAKMGWRVGRRGRGGSAGKWKVGRGRGRGRGWGWRGMGAKMGWRAGRRGRGGSAGESGCVAHLLHQVFPGLPFPPLPHHPAASPPSPSLYRGRQGWGRPRTSCITPTASASAPRTPASAVERLAPPVLPSSPAPAAPAPLLARCTADVDGVQHPRGNRSCVGSGPTSRSFAGSASGSSTSFPLLFCITTDDTDGVYRPHGNMACIGVLGPSVLQLTLPALSSHRCAVSIPPGPRLRCAANALGQCLCLRRAPVAAPPQHRHYVDAMPGLRLSGEMRTSGIMEGEDRARGRARRTGQHGEGRMCGDDG
ncbi:hypothetical protein B0H14DRAFT_462141 [Mycena olivaceomarginata]|nr:hypothetical protein B0H14DRAFT_462141 [Mycena olivaceomarginata]